MCVCVCVCEWTWWQSIPRVCYLLAPGLVLSLLQGGCRSDAGEGRGTGASTSQTAASPWLNERGVAYGWWHRTVREPQVATGGGGAAADKVGVGLGIGIVGYVFVPSTGM
ncbi:hypothetical protein LZ30DRAFT_714091 [Colletotrichum cereale]|nr:hypothetical protein LZ30DRAFT_714091 [Colletotrichum cereale]